MRCATATGGSAPPGQTLTGPALGLRAQSFVVTRIPADRPERGDPNDVADDH
jgi:hypothetical protein